MSISSYTKTDNSLSSDTPLLAAGLFIFGNAMTPQFAAFVKRITKLESPRFLTKQSISNVIIGLENWLEYKKVKNDNCGMNKHAPKIPLNVR